MPHFVITESDGELQDENESTPMGKPCGKCWTKKRTRTEEGNMQGLKFLFIFWVNNISIFKITYSIQT